MENKRNFIKYLLFVFMCLFSFVSLYPLFWMISQSLKNDLELYSNQFAISLNPKWVNYAVAWIKAGFGVYYKNSILVTALTIGISLLFNSLASYAFANIKFKGKKVFMLLLVAAMFLPGIMLLFPVYMTIRSLGLLDSYLGLLGPYVCGSIPMGCLILTNAFKGVPKELAESAKIDGCNHYRIWWKILLPIIKPMLATLTILYFLQSWNEYMWAMVSISNKKLFTIPIGLVDVASKVYIYGYGTVFAGLTLATLPIMIVYIALNKQFVKAIASGSVKG
ncbi:MAG: carbohydrate ABC transporter permease [Actinobacteria bacterium]|nr:carbohydrate ABC transporter permease [Actinomycetota bacterium]